MELRRLSSFVVLAEELHFGRAARRLHLSQPPLSAQIMKLEDELGARLFDRNNRRVELTDAGRALLDRARHLLAEVDRARKEVMRVAAGEAGALSIAYTPTATYRVMPPLLQAFRRRHPEVRLDLHELSSPAQVLALREGRVEVGFACLPVDAGDLASELVDEDDLVVALPRRHPLARLASVPVRALATEPFIAVDETVEPGWARAADVAVRAAGVHPRVVQQTDTKIALVGLIAAGLGVGLVSASMAALGRQHVVLRPLDGLRVRLPLGLLSRKALSPRALRFTALARELAVCKEDPERAPKPPRALATRGKASLRQRVRPRR
jgi:DNA-binding transcriptional LysR family regulator